MIKTLLEQKPLFVFALESEASDKFNDVTTLFVGVGKINAAYNLTKRINENRPSIIVNLGSAGSNTFTKGSVVCCNTFIQRDMDTTMLGTKKYETAFSGVPPLLQYGLTVDRLQLGICGTGDSFEVNHITNDYNVVEMEAYSLAYIASEENIPFLCLKYVSDGADGSAADDWGSMVNFAAEALRNEIDNIKKQ